MDLRNQNWFKYVIVAAASVLVTVILLTLLVVFRLEERIWENYGFTGGIRWLFGNLYKDGHIPHLIIGASAVILIAILVRAVVAILPHYAQSIKDIEARLDKEEQALERKKYKEEQALERKKQEVEAQGRELKQKRQRYLDQVAGVETKCRKLEKRVGGLRGRIKQVAEMLEEEQPQIGKARSLLFKAYKAKGDKIEPNDSELSRLRAENEFLFTEKGQLKEEKIKLKKNALEFKKEVESLSAEVEQLEYDKERLQDDLEKYLDAEERRKKRRRR